MSKQPPTFDDVFDPDIEELKRAPDSPRKAYLLKHLHRLKEALNEWAAAQYVEKPISKPYLPEGFRLPTETEYLEVARIQAEVDKLKKPLKESKGKEKKDLLQKYRDLVHKRVATIGPNVYYVPGSGRFTKEKKE